MEIKLWFDTREKERECKHCSAQPPTLSRKYPPREGDGGGLILFDQSEEGGNSDVGADRTRRAVRKGPRTHTADIRINKEEMGRSSDDGTPPKGY